MFCPKIVLHIIKNNIKSNKYYYKTIKIIYKKLFIKIYNKFKKYIINYNL